MREGASRTAMCVMVRQVRLHELLTKFICGSNLLVYIQTVLTERMK